MRVIVCAKSLRCAGVICTLSFGVLEPSSSLMHTTLTSPAHSLHLACSLLCMLVGSLAHSLIHSLDLLLAQLLPSSTICSLDHSNTHTHSLTHPTHQFKCTRAACRASKQGSSTSCFAAKGMHSFSVTVTVTVPQAWSLLPAVPVDWQGTRSQ